jgi:rod shape-determining protein MreC
LFAPRLDWMIFLAAVGISLALLFIANGQRVTTVRQEVGGIIAQAGRPVMLARRTFSLWKENSLLREEALTLSEENGALRDAALENERLRAMLGFHRRFPLNTESAEVIGYPGSRIGGRMLIDVGSHDGVRLNSAVITPDGLVGKVTEVAEFTSLVQTLQGNAYGVSVMIERSRVAGILRWLGPGQWSIVGLATGEDVRVGDLVLTTGAGSVFPPNIRVGVVSRIVAQSETKTGWCRVQPFVRFESLEEVFVITQTGHDDRAIDSLMAKEDRP